MKKFWIAGGVLLVLVLLRIGLTLTSHESDVSQIQGALAESIKAGKEGQPDGVMQLLGNQLTVNSQDASGEFSQVAQFIKKQHPDVTFENQTPLITGDSAQITSSATIDLQFLGQHRIIHLKTVLLIFHKELGTKYFFFPAKKWKLEQVEVPDFSPDQLAG
jgi:hypothetical protein